MPDLILVDGGRGQLNSALKALSELGVEETPLVALAKREEELYLPGRPEPLRLPRTDEGLKLLQRIRDEAHRFAVGRHRRRRSRRILRSGLDDIPGLGPIRKRRLIRAFGSPEGVAEASSGELVDLLGPVMGRRVHEILRQNGATAVENGPAEVE